MQNTKYVGDFSIFYPYDSAKSIFKYYFLIRQIIYDQRLCGIAE